MAQLLLEGIQSTPTIKEIDSVTVAEQMGVDSPLEVGMVGSQFDNLVSSLLGDMVPLAGGKQESMSLQA